MKAKNDEKPRHKIIELLVSKRTEPLSPAAAMFNPVRVKFLLSAEVRQAQSWNEIEAAFGSYGFTLFPGLDDIYALNFETEQVIFLGSSGHDFMFLVERLGMPPANLLPHTHEEQMKAKENGESNTAARLA